MDILPDKSLLIQILNFLILLFILNLILFRPVRKMLRERKANMDGLSEARADFETRASHAHQNLQEQNDLARQKGVAVKTLLVEEAMGEEDKLIQDAINVAGQKSGKEKEQIGRQETDARMTLDPQVDLFSKALAEKFLNRSLS